MGRLIVTNRYSYIGPKMVSVWIDKIKVGKVYSTETVSFDVEDGVHTVKASFLFVSTQEYSLRVDGDTAMVIGESTARFYLVPFAGVLVVLSMFMRGYYAAIQLVVCFCCSHLYLCAHTAKKIFLDRI